SMKEKLVPFGAVVPERRGTSWSGVFTLTGSQAMSQSLVPKSGVDIWVVDSSLEVTSTPIAFHLETASSAAALPTGPRARSWRNVSDSFLPPLARMPSDPFFQPAASRAAL